MMVALGSFRTLSITAFGSAPYPTRSPSTRTASCGPALASVASSASRFACTSLTTRYFIRSEVDPFEQAAHDLGHRVGCVDSHVRVCVGELPSRVELFH